MERNKLKISLVFLVVLAGINLLYFYAYFSFLGMPFSWLQIFFILIGTLSLFLLVDFWRSRLWRYLGYALIFVFYWWTLINFAYFTVFKTFLAVSWGQLATVNMSLLEMLKDFYGLVPSQMYIIALVTFVGVVVDLIVYCRFMKMSAKNILFNDSQLRVVFKNKNRHFYQVFFLIILFTLVNLGAFLTCAYFSLNPRIDWWERESQAADLGIWGHFYTQVYARAEAGEASSGVDLTEDPLDKTKETYAEMGRLAGVEVAAVDLPKFKNKPNIFIIQMESNPVWLAKNEPSVMPFLKSLMDNYLTVGQFYPNSCTTNNAEFATLCSFWPNSYEPINYSHKGNRYNCLPHILKEKYGYSTYFLHSDYPDFWERDKIIGKWGFDNKFFVPYFKLKEDDASVFTKAVEILKEADKPFFSFIPSFNSHAPHDEDMMIYQKYANGLIVEPYAGEIEEKYLKSIKLSEKDLRLYLGFVRSADDALRSWWQAMEEADLFKDTVVLIYNDHRYYQFTGENELNNFEWYNEAPMVMILPDKQKGILQSQASHVDLAPTLLNLVEGDEYTPQDNFLGISLFSDKYPGQAMNKCNGMIYYVNGRVMVEGNASTKLYNFLQVNEGVTEIEKKTWLNLVRELVVRSDETIYSDRLVR